MSVDDEKLEALLAGLPRPQPDPAREAELLRALMSAETRRPWWRRMVPLWQAAAACLLVGILVGGLTWSRPGKSPRASRQMGPREAPAVVYAEPRTPLFETDAAVAAGLDVSRWKVISVQAEGVER